MTFTEFLQQHYDPFARYLEYKANQDGVDMDEAASRSLGRLFAQVSGSPNTLVIITAFRGENTLAVDRARNAQLSSELRGLGWGSTPVLGGFVETTPDRDGRPQQQRVQEESFFVNASGDARGVTARVISLLGKYQQEAALVKFAGSETASLLYTNGQTVEVGRWQGDPDAGADRRPGTRAGGSRRSRTFRGRVDVERIGYVGRQRRQCRDDYKINAEQVVSG